MRLNAVKVLEISITNNYKKEVLEEIQKYLLEKQKKTLKPLVIFTPNAEQFVFATHHPYFLHILNQADVMLPDSVGVAWASRILTKNGVSGPIAGVDFMENVLALAANRHVPIGLIGGRSKLAVKTLECLQQKYGQLADSWGEDGPEIDVEHGEVRFKNKDRGMEKDYFRQLARKIIHSGVQIVFVGLGPPKQEYFILALQEALFVEAKMNRPIVLMAVGGSFDIISGRLHRAPQFMRSVGLEWLWRLILEPWRIVRQLSLIEFVWLVVRAKMERLLV